MLNSVYKKNSLATLNDANNKYQITYNATVKNITTLYEIRLNAVALLKDIEDYITSLANRPYEYDKIIREIKIRRQKFETEAHNLELESKEAEKVSGTVAGAGALTGAGIAAFGPSAAMAVAMTFGTASTGTAIATLSGAAATNAALAWLGGGALVAGGAGVTGGEAFLALAGPIGWTIGGVALVGGGLLLNSKNKKIAEKAEASTRIVKREIERIKEINIKVSALKKATNDMYVQLRDLLCELKATNIFDYELFGENQVNELMKLMNVAESLSKKIGEVVA